MAAAFGTVHGGEKPQAPPSWGFVPASGSSGLVPSSCGGSGPYASSPYASSPYDSFPCDGYPASGSTDASYPTEGGYNDKGEYLDAAGMAKEEKRRLDKKDRKKKRKRNDAKTAAEMLLYMGGINALLWTIPCFGTGWHQKMFTGFGIGFTRIKTSLFTMEVNVECHVMKWPFGLDSEAFTYLRPDEKVCKIFAHMNGTHSLHSAKDLACNLGASACSTMETVFYSSFFLIFAFGLSALTALIGVLFLYFYWYQEHLKIIRQSAQVMYVISPIFGTLAFVMYCIICPDLGEIPRTWTAFIGNFNGGTGLGGIHAIGEDTLYNKYGWCWFFCLFSISSSMFSTFTWAKWFEKHTDERGHEKAARNEILELEEVIAGVEEEQVQVESAASTHDRYAGNYAAPQYPGACSAPQYGAYGAQSAYGAQPYVGPFASPPVAAYGGAPGYNGGGYGQGHPQQYQPGY